MNPKVSVIVPVYNVEKYLPECLDSLVNQTLEDIEILVVNDGSPDNSQAIIDDYAARYPDKIRAFIKENGGQSDARNLGVQYAVGEYLGFVDSDDYVSADMFSTMYQKGIESNSDVVVCDFYNLVGENVEKAGLIKNPEQYPCSVEANPNILFECKCYPCNKLFRRSWYTENQFAFPNGQWFEDSAVVYNILYMAKSIDAVSEAYYYYRKDRPDSVTNTVNKRVYDIFKSCTSIHNFYYGKTNDRKILDVADRICQIHIFVRMKALLGKGTAKMRLQFYNRTLKYFKKYMPEWEKNPYYLKIKKKKSLWLQVRHIPWLARIYLWSPEKVEGIFDRYNLVVKDNCLFNVRVKKKKKG